MFFASLRIIFSLFLVVGSWATWAQQSTLPFEQSNDLFAVEQEQELLPQDEAFIFDFSQKGDKLQLKWQVAKGYYLYKKQFKFVGKRAEVGEAEFPPAKEIEDEFFGISDIYDADVTLTLDLISAEQDSVVKVRYQGCAEAGFCYPPTIREVYLTKVGAAGNTISDAELDEIIGDKGAEQGALTEQDQLKNLLLNSDSLWTLAIFFGLGIALAFTPCVFPMYPILSGIIVGQGNKLKTGKAFALSMAYVQGMALTYSILGLVIASAGAQYQAALQHPYVLIPLAILFVVLAMSMFGAYELTMPSSWQAKLHNASNKQQGGQLFGVFVMGAISGLVASPCTTAPLSGVLLFVAQSGDLVFGGAALYALSLGMGVPLILLGTSGGKLLPKAGAWMNVVKVGFGFMLIAVSIVMIERLIDQTIANLMWALWLLATFTYFHIVNTDTQASLAKGVRQFVIFIGLLVAGISGYQTLFPSQQQQQSHGEFIHVKSLADMEQKIAQANAQGKLVMVDLYADWCVACKEFEKYTFPAPAVQALFKDYVLLQADLTENTPTTEEYYEQLAVLGLPTMLFYDLQGREIDSLRVTGFMHAQPFAEHLGKVKQHAQ